VRSLGGYTKKLGFPQALPRSLENFRFFRDVSEVTGGCIKKLGSPRHSPGTYETSEFKDVSKVTGGNIKKLASQGTPHECNLGLFGSASRSTACADRFLRANA